jgi:hypothetical protein
MQKFGSDKGGDHHNYTETYKELFESRRMEPLRVFEVGLGTNHTDVPSNMGPDGKPGASLRGWAEYFPNAQIFGADVDSRVLFEEPRIKTYFVDQTKPDTIRSLWNNAELEEGFDIIIDDGLHTYAANKTFFDNSFHKLKPGGYYIVEDLAPVEMFRNWGHGSRIVSLAHEKNTYDNHLLIIGPPGEAVSP